MNEIQVMKTGAICSLPTAKNKVGYLAYYVEDEALRSNPKIKRYILYWPFNENGVTYNFKINESVKFDTKKMSLKRNGKSFIIDVAVNLRPIIPNITTL